MPAKYQLLNPYPREALRFVAAVERAARWVRAARRGLGTYYGLTVAQWRMLESLNSLDSLRASPSLGRSASANASAGFSRSSLAEYDLLRLAQEFERPNVAPVNRKLAEPSIAELAFRLGITRQSAHSVAAELGCRGLLELASDGHDRRRLIVRMTPAGRQCLEEISATMRSLLLKMTNELAPDALDTMSHALNDISRRVRACRHIIAGKPRRSARKAR